MKITIPISIGELIDKITILQIKSLFTDDSYVHKELEDLNKIKFTITQPILEYELELRKVNEKLWKIENDIRKKEQKQEFDEEFIKLSRSVYITNDERAEIKRKINEITNSEYKEIKVF